MKIRILIVSAVLALMTAHSQARADEIPRPGDFCDGAPMSIEDAIPGTYFRVQQIDAIFASSDDRKSTSLEGWLYRGLSVADERINYQTFVQASLASSESWRKDIGVGGLVPWGATNATPPIRWNGHLPQNGLIISCYEWTPTGNVQDAGAPAQLERNDKCGGSSFQVGDRWVDGTVVSIDEVVNGSEDIVAWRYDTDAGKHFYAATKDVPAADLKAADIGTNRSTFKELPDGLWPDLKIRACPVVDVERFWERSDL